MAIMTKRGHKIILAWIIALLFSLLSPLSPAEWFPGFVVILLGCIFLYKTLAPSIPLAFVILGILAMIGIMPLYVLSAALLVIASGELLFHYSGQKPISYGLYFVAALFFCLVLMYYTEYYTGLTAVMGVTVAVLLRSILGGSKQAYMLELLGTAMAMLLIHELNMNINLQLLAYAMVISFGFAYFAYRFKTADISGLFAAALIGIVLIVFADVRWFLIMLLFFVLAMFATKYKIEYKRSIRVEEEKGGIRGYVNMFSNGLAPTIAAVCYGIYPHPIFVAAFLGGVATAAADTNAGEIGVCGGEPYLITNLKRVPHGTNGGVTLLGEAAGLLTATLIGAGAAFLGVADLPLFIATICSGFLGTNLDSLFGQILENKGYIKNAGTNLLATSCGCIAGAGIWLVLTMLL
jgi:uncharacterized protein (TIGR00297 family)